MKLKASMKLSFIIFLLIHVTAYTEIAISQNQLEESTSFKITIDTDGSATWIIERRFLLKTEEDETIFQLYASEFEAQKDTYLEDFTNETEDLVDRASLITGRSMNAENFDIIIDSLETATGSYGIIIYQYDWIGFAKIEGERIIIGDVFEGGFYLYRDDTLIIKYPQEYAVQAVSPTPDETKAADQTLIWYGRRNFGAGEPTVILRKPMNYLPLIASLILIAGLGCAGLWFFRFRKGVKKGVEEPLPKEKFEVRTDEDRVVEMLKSVGGRIYQSMITKRLGFSKAKTSILLKAMEEKGLVKRKKMGREMLVTLLQEEKNSAS